MNIKDLIDGVIKVANLASNVIPGAGLVAQGGAIGEKIIGIIDDLQQHADPSQQAEMQAERAKLADAVKAHAASTSDRLRG